MKKITQNRLILDYLLKGHNITPLVALEKFGCFRLGARIWELRNIKAIPIESNLIPLKGGKHISSYHINNINIKKIKSTWKTKGLKTIY